MQRKLIAATLIALSASALAQSTDAKPTLTGHWTANIDYYGTHANFGFDVTQQGDKLTGKFRGDPLEGTIDGSSFHFLVKDNEGGTAQVKGTIVNNTLQGEVIETDGSTPTKPATYTFTATQRPPRSSAPPERHEFTPTVFYRQFSPLTSPSSPSIRVTPSTPQPSTPEATTSTARSASWAATHKRVLSSSSPPCPATSSSSTSIAFASTAIGP